MKNIKPLGNHVLIEVISQDKKTKSGIYIPETVDKEKPDQGTVVAVGPGKRDEAGKTIPMQVKKGDLVVFSKYSPDEINIDNKKYFVISEDNILAIIN